jgi:hypothetical protein
VKRAAICAALPLASLGYAAKEKGDWSPWTATTNSPYRDQYGYEHTTTDIDFRYRLSAPCTPDVDRAGRKVDCHIDVALRNNEDRRESVNYIIFIEDHNGDSFDERDRINIYPHTVEDLVVAKQGRIVSRVDVKRD